MANRPLRDLLAVRVAERRRNEMALEPRTGVFSDLAECPTIRFSTTGRRTGIRREKWWIPFFVDGDTIYLIEELAEQALWVANITADPNTEVGAEGRPWRRATARRVTDDNELARARRLMTGKFGGGDWALVADGTVIAFDAA